MDRLCAVTSQDSMYNSWVALTLLSATDVGTCFCRFVVQNHERRGIQLRVGLPMICSYRQSSRTAAYPIISQVPPLTWCIFHKVPLPLGSRDAGCRYTGCGCDVGEEVSFWVGLTLVPVFVDDLTTNSAVFNANQIVATSRVDSKRVRGADRLINANPTIQI